MEWIDVETRMRCAFDALEHHDFDPAHSRTLPCVQPSCRCLTQLIDRN